MMLTVSKLAFKKLNDLNVANDYFKGGIYPLAAPIETQYPFAVYQLNKSFEVTKNGVHNFDLTISIVGNDHDLLCSISDAVESDFEPDSRLHYTATETGVNGDNPDEYVFTMKFNIKMF